MVQLSELQKRTPLRLNVGSGNRPREGWVNIDFDHTCNPDLVWDIKDGLPFKNDSVDEFYFSHIVEHLTNEQITLLMREIWRCGKKGAKAEIIVPHWNFDVAWSLDHRSVPGHKRFFDIWQPGFSAVQNYVKWTLGFMFFNILKAHEDTKGKIHPEPQTYFLLEVDKSAT